MRDIIAHRIAGSLLALEGIGLLVLVGWQVVALAGGDTGILTTALALLVLTLAGAAIVLAFAGATWRRVSWGRSGGIVTQLLILAVALGAATGAYAQPFSALLLAAPGWWCWSRSSGRLGPRRPGSVRRGCGPRGVTPVRSQAARPRMLRTRATWPVALTL